MDDIFGKKTKRKFEGKYFFLLLFTKQSCKLNIQIMVLEMKIYVNLLKSRALVVSSDDSFLFGGLKGRKVFFRFVASFWGSFYGVKIELLDKVFWGQNMFSGRFLGSFVWFKLWISKLWLSIFFKISDFFLTKCSKTSVTFWCFDRSFKIFRTISENLL